MWRLDTRQDLGQNRSSAMDEDENPALRAANLALSGRKHREVTRLASIELRYVDAKSGPWEAVAMFSVATMTMLGVLALWFW